MNKLQVWNYDESVKKMKVLVYKWKNMTVEMLDELWIANNNLSNQGARTDLGANASKLWKTYCEDIGINKSTANRWLVYYDHETKQILDKKKQIERINKSAIFPDGKYSIIYADPPWKYDNSGFDESAQSHYDTMTIEQLKALPVQDLKTNDTVLFLWITNPLLSEVFEIINMWEFTYKTNIAWIKNKGPSIGWFVNSRHELLLIATAKGNRHPAEKYNSWFEADVTKHSKKPEVVYNMIEQMYAGPYIELFARTKRPGWDSWGNELSYQNLDMTENRG